MIVTRQIGIRIGAILLLALLAQVAFFSYFQVFGATPDLLPVVVCALGLLGGAVTGAAIGFIAGLLLDTVLLSTLGVSSLVLIGVGYVAGRYRESFEIDSPLAPAILAGSLTFLAAAGFTAMQLTLGPDATVSGLIVRETIMKGILGFLLMYPVYPVVKFVLRPALVLEDPVKGKPSPRSSAARARRRTA